MNIPYLSSNDLDALNLSTQDIISGIERVIKGSEAGTVWSAPKAFLTTPNDQRYMMAALAAMDGPSMLAVKTVVLNPDNNARGIPQINGLVTMLDSDTGLPLAILDGNWITAVRTAGLSAVAAKYMARQDAESIAFVGCGVQARSHFEAFRQMFPLKRMQVFGRGAENQNKLLEIGAAHGLEGKICDSGQEAIEDVDLIVTTVTHTGGAEPFLDADGMKAGAFVTVVDLAAPWKRESFGALDTVIVDDLAQENALPNKLCNPDLIDGDLSGLVLAKVVGRENEKARTGFVFRGHALGDLGLSVLALEKHLKLNAD